MTDTSYDLALALSNSMSKFKQNIEYKPESASFYQFLNILIALDTITGSDSTCM